MLMLQYTYLIAAGYQQSQHYICMQICYSLRCSKIVDDLAAFLFLKALSVVN